MCRYYIRFYQSKEVCENENLLSVILGRRTELSIIIRPVREDESSLSIRIYQTTLEKNLYYHEEGICEDKTMYQAIIRGILDTE